MRQNVPSSLPVYSVPDAEAMLALPLASCGVPIYLVPKEVSVKDACAALSAEPVIGFDTETKPAFRPGQKFPPALLQLATANAIYLFQFAIIKDLNPIKKLLLNASMKVGVGVPEDLRRLQAYFKIPFAKQFADLTVMAKAKGIPTGSLRGLTAVMLKQRLSKSAQLTNWAKEDLLPNQIRYAALDAWVSREVYLKMIALP